MTLSLPLPPTRTDNASAFFDASSALDWLGRQPQANASAMLSELLRQIQAYNSYQTPPRQRFKTLEALRKTIFSVSGECQRRYENRQLPLLPAEQAMLDAVRGLWRNCAVAYLHCLQACLDGDASIAGYGVKVAHRALACLRLEQMNGYLACSEPVSTFWLTVHAVFAAAERLGVTLEPVEDRLLGETSDSTVSAQYCMTLLLHMAGPFALTRSHFVALSRWLARWREQAKLAARPDSNAKACCIALDLAQDQPLHEPARAAAEPRWLLLNNVLRKIRKRVEMLEAGETPENLKLGSGLSSEACISLLTQLAEHLRHPPQADADAMPGSTSVMLAAGLDNIHLALGGRGLADPLASSMSASRLRADQIAVFGHVVESGGGKEAQTEQWWLLKQEMDVLRLQRSLACGEARLVLKGLLAVKLPGSASYSLAVVRQLAAGGEGAAAHLNVVVSLYAGSAQPLVAEAREKGSGKTLRYPAFMLPPEGGSGRPASVILPSGVTARALSLRFYDGRERQLPDMQLAEFVERHADCEHWLLNQAAVTE
jgi:hypothetical protein